MVSLPNTAELNIHGARNRAIIPNRQPAVFAWSEPHTFPFIKWDQLVVIPHEGHRVPVNCTSVHGGSPNC